VLFSSYEFIFFFLPAVLGGFLALSRFRQIRLAAAWLALASIFFYGYWSPRYVFLLMGSIGFNFLASKYIQRFCSAPDNRRMRMLLGFSIAVNLCILGYFKYANFFSDSVNSLLGTGWQLASIILPIGISFFTFTQIAFLVDTYQGKVRESSFVPYLLFVTYFPHLIAGPVLHHAEMMPQFSNRSTYRFCLKNFVAGAAFFVIGLFKKVILADGIQPFVAPVFEANPSYTLSLIEAWGAALAYSLQLYFDFSGYSDMAIGLSKMFNVNLPLNFNSPYKARSIIDFWRRWHMTLSRFLRDYLYIALGGNRNGKIRRYINLLLTMLLGGMWHGAGWTFIIWGGLHGLYLIINHLWGALKKSLFPPIHRWQPLANALAVLLTFISVVIAWVFFRALNIESALRVIFAMVGLNGFTLPIQWEAELTPLLAKLPGNPQFAAMEAFGGCHQLLWIGLLLACAWLLPNSQQLVECWVAKPGGILQRNPNLSWVMLGSVSTLVVLLAAINASLGTSEFIYFNF
jgi:alginate O-acetyltransferase complex protein AlgI